MSTATLPSRPNAFRRMRKKVKTMLNMPRLYRNWKAGKTIVEGAYPDRLYIEITNSCNIECVMCPTGLKRLGRDQGRMEVKHFKKIIDEMAPHVKTTTLHIWGEPLLHPRLEEMIAYATRKGINVATSTNATILTEKRAKSLLKSGLREIYLCLDGMDAETYESIRKTADFEQTKANIERFIELRAQADVGPRTYVQLIEMEPTAEQAQAFREYWTRPGVDRVNIKAFDSWGNQDKDINKLRDDEQKKAMPSLKDRYQCPLLWYHCHVYWDGTVTCCDRDFGAKYPLGNVFEAGSVMAVWNGPKMQELRRKHVVNDVRDVPACRSCTEWAWWKPAPFRAHGNAPQDR